MKLNHVKSREILIIHVPTVRCALIQANSEQKGVALGSAHHCLCRMLRALPSTVMNNAPGLALDLFSAIQQLCSLLSNEFIIANSKHY